jgi:hypothetical protein
MDNKQKGYTLGNLAYIAYHLEKESISDIAVKLGRSEKAIEAQLIKMRNERKFHEYRKLYRR